MIYKPPPVPTMRAQSAPLRRPCLSRALWLLSLFHCSSPQGADSFQPTASPNTKRSYYHAQILDVNIQRNGPRFVIASSYDRPSTRTKRISTCVSGKKVDDAEDDISSQSTIYKDDCFGFTSFLAGIAVQDYLFTIVFVSLSLLADALTRLGLLPPDSKRPKIVDRRVPGAIALLTLWLTQPENPITYDLLHFNDLSPVDAGDMTLARTVQLGVCSFSIITSFLGIRWRDPIDYPS